jgi:predicted nuclease of predicted toxin-antitoxin system
VTVAVGDMRFFADHNIPESVCQILEAAGFETIRLRHKTAADSPDMLVAAVSEANGAILVTMDSDFKSIASRTGIGQRRFRKLSLLRFEKCRESQAASRLKTAMSLIEHEWKVGNSSSDRRMFVVITGHSIRTYR